MKEKLFIFGALALLVVLLVGLNAASYVQREQIPDSESAPNRSTYSTGATGTRAFYDLLSATSRDVQRWEEPFSQLKSDGTSEIGTFVIIGKTRKEILDEEISRLISWVEWGGRLVIIDRNPPVGLLETSGAWKVRISETDPAISAAELEVLLPTVDPSNQAQMTSGAVAAKSFQPTLFTARVNAIQPSKFATSVTLKKTGLGGSESSDSAISPPESVKVESSETPPPMIEEQAPSAESPVVRSPGSIAVETPVESTTPEEQAESLELEKNKDQTPGAGSGSGVPMEIVTQDSPSIVTSAPADVDGYEIIAPVAHFGNSVKTLVVDFPYGDGSIVVVSDPYIVSNGGINLVDNAQLATNVVSGNGRIAFDEYHQGYGSNQNRLLNYFYGTPVIPVFLQLVLIVGLVMISLSRRFARPLPLEKESRISNLEYVGAMAQLKRRTKAYDLAIENIYTDFRRRISRLAGIDNSSSSNDDIAEAIEFRTDYKKDQVLEVMSKCEDIMHGEATNNNEVLVLAAQLRKIESALGLRRGRTIFKR